MATPAELRQQAAQELLRLREAEETFLGFVRYLFPDWKLARFQVDLINKLDLLGQRELYISPSAKRHGYPPILNLLITMPPRHAKSTFATVLFPVWMMAKNPRRFILSSSYNAQLASDFGRQVRDYVAEDRVKRVFPHLALSPESRANDIWRTETGGAYFGVGLGGTTTGRPSNILNIDDPIKSREEAESQTMRNKVWDYYTSALTTRMQPEDDGTPPIQIVTLTRWHPDDLAGRLMRTEDWKEGRWLHIDYPAIRTRATTYNANQLPTDDPDYDPRPANMLPHKLRNIVRHEEFALWPERFPLEDLKRRQRLNPRDFASLYQQQPYIEGGNILKSEWWQYYDVSDGITPANFQTLIIATDTAFKKDETNDFSVAVVMGLTTSGDIYVLDVVRGRWEFPALKQRMINLNATWRGRGLRAIYVEDKASGQSLIQELRRESGLSVIPYKVSRDKVTRVNSITPIVEGGRVFLPKNAKWLDDFVNETTAFPSGSNDDQVDAFTMGLDILSRQTVTPDALYGQLDASDSLNQQVARQIANMSKPLAAGTFKRWGE